MIHKVLIIAYSYPPYNSMGALRASKFAKYLLQYGWEPIVVTMALEPKKGGLEDPKGVRVIRTSYRDRLQFFRRGRFDKTIPLYQDLKSKGKYNTISNVLTFCLKEFLVYPDSLKGWRSFALQAARKILQEENISLIFSSCPPPTSHIIASELKRETGLPWVADFRDLWTQNHYIRHTLFRRWIETKLEKKTLEGADILITVSQPLAEKLKALHKKPVEVITNGFDEDDYTTLPPPLTNYFSLTYTGNIGQIYSGKRDPSVLFAAIKDLMDSKYIDAQRFQIRFYGPDRDRVELLRLASHYGTQKVVSHGGPVPYHEAILRQRESTALLLLNWNSPEEKGVYTGKVFEYLGARRPILAIPKNEGVLDELLRKTNSGFTASTKEEIGRIIKNWYDEFVETGNVSFRKMNSVIMQYTRASQTRRLVTIFECIKNKQD